MYLTKGGVEKQFLVTFQLYAFFRQYKNEHTNYEHNCGCCHNSCSHDNTLTTLSAHVGNVLSQLMISVCNVQTQFDQLLTRELNSERWLQCDRDMFQFGFGY